MKKLGTLLIAFAVVAICCVFLLPTEVQAATSGTCGDNLTWTLDDEGTLTISGTGAMISYDQWSWSAYPWYKNTAVQRVVIEDGITTIGDYAFRECTGLSSVTIPDSVTTIGAEVFYGCTGLTSVTIGDGVTTMGPYAFSNCNSLSAVHISDIAAWCGIYFEVLDSNPLYYAKNLYLNGELVKEIEIPEGVSAISNYVFAYCRSLTSVTIPNSVTSIGVDAFERCYQLTNVVIGNGITSIGADAFADCINLTDIYYGGTESDWDAINVNSGNAYLFAATLHCTNGCDHTWGEGTVTKQATCNEYGQKTYTCSSCGSTKTEPLPKTNAHSYNGVITKDATCKETGVVTYTCAVCADTYTEVIEKSTDHNYTDGVCTVCGGEDPDYVVPEEPSKPEDPSEPTVPSEPTEPDEEESANPIMAILNAILDALKALLAIFGIKL